MAINRPTTAALNFLDYVSYDNRNATCAEELTQSTVEMVTDIENKLGVNVGYFGVGPRLTETFAVRHLADATQGMNSRDLLLQEQRVVN
jgi:adenylosuccinate synthase